MNELTKDTFEQAKEGKVLVDFWAPWCGPCKQLGPNFEEASKEAEGVKFFKVNVDEQSELAGEFEVRSIPTILFLENGEVKERTVGALGKGQILDKIEEVFE